MSTYRTDAHEHVDDGAVHAHVSSVPFYVAVFVGLLVLTGMTVGQSYVDLGKLNIVIVVLIATMKLPSSSRSSCICVGTTSSTR